MPALQVKVVDTKAKRQLTKTFFSTPVRIGRNPMADLPINSPYVSQWHCVIRFSVNTVEFLDLGSTNGTLLNGHRLTPYKSTPILPTDRLAIGPVHLQIQPSKEAPPPRKTSDRERGGAGDTRIDQQDTQRLRQLDSALEEIAPPYEQYRAQWEKLHSTLQRVFGALHNDVREDVISMLTARCATLHNEPEYNVLIATPNTGQQSTALNKLLGLAAQSAGASPASRDAFERVGDVLNAFASSFVELRKGLDQFSNDLALRTFKESTPIHKAPDGKALLTYLLGAKDEVAGRVHELNGAFADMMIHQVALISGVMEGVRALLSELGPDAIRESLKKHPERVGLFKIKRGIWPFSATARWRRLSRLHRSFMEEDQGLSSVLFGREFARSYGATKVAPHVATKPGLRESPEESRPQGTLKT